MFYSATAFDDDLSGWSMGDVFDASRMFRKASRFTNGGKASELSRWTVSSVCGLSRMFDERGFPAASYPDWYHP